MYPDRPTLFIVAAHSYNALQDRERTVHHLHHTGEILDDLHQAVVDATERARADDPTALHTDTWDPSLDPPAAVRAHVVPLMKTEIERLKRQIQQVSLTLHFSLTRLSLIDH